MDIHGIRQALNSRFQSLHANLGQLTKLVADSDSARNPNNAEAAHHLLDQVAEHVVQMQALLAPIWQVEVAKPEAMHGRDTRRHDKARHQRPEHSAESSPAT